MNSQQPSQQPQPGNRLETMLVSEATLAPFPPGEYAITLSSMEHPPQVFANTPFPCVLVTVLPGSRNTTRLSASDGQAVWITQRGEKVELTVSAPGGLVLFTTYRPSNYATTGLHLDIQRLSAASPQAPTPHPAPGMGQAPQAPPAAPGFGGNQSLAYAPQAPAAPYGGFPGGQPSGQAASPYGRPSLVPPAAPGFGQPPQMPPAAPGFGQPSLIPPAAPGFGQSPLAPPAAPGYGSPLTPPSAPGFGGGQSLTYASTPQAPQAPHAYAAPRQPAGPTPGVRMAGHVEGEGDVAFEPGQGAGRPGSKRRLEAVALYIESVGLQDVAYAAIAADGQPMPWVSPPQFTGSRVSGAPLLGFAARLSGEAARRYSIAYAGTFLGAGPVSPVRDGEFLRSPADGDPLESLTIILEPKS